MIQPPRLSAMLPSPSTRQRRPSVPRSHPLGRRPRRSAVLFGFALCVVSLLSQADINVGVTLSATGPAASLGIPEKNTFALLPGTIAGEKVNYLVLDDATDPSQANRNVRRLTAENKVDVVIGSTTTPTSLAALEVAVETQTPLITMAPTPFAPDKAAWGFQTPQNVALMASALVEHMKASGVRTLAFIGYADAYGDLWWNVIGKQAEAAGIKVTLGERYQRADTSVTGQVLRILSANPDAVLVAGSGTPAVLPQATLVERNYKGRVYQTHGVANRDFLRVGGKNVEGTIFPVGPILVAEQLPDSHPSKQPALAFIRAYEAVHGADSRSTFGAHAWDAALLLNRAVPEALKKAKPGTLEFRKALRDALESARDVAAAHGVFNMTPTDHQGFDERARVLVRIENGNWKLAK